MHASDVLFDFHAIFEGIHAEPYDDGTGVLTIGIGHTGNDFDENSFWDDDKIREVWERDVLTAERLANSWLAGAEVPQELFDALVDLAFNTGTKPRTLMAYIREGNFDYAIHELPRWVYAGGKVMLGLVKRRMAMYVYCKGGDWEEIANCPLKRSDYDQFNKLIAKYGFEIVPDEETEFALEEI